MTPQKLKERKERIRKLDRALKKLYPDPHIELSYSTPWQLLVAVQLSAQSTDKNVNKITEKLFTKYKTLDDYVHAAQLRKWALIGNLCFSACIGLACIYAVLKLSFT